MTDHTRREILKGFSIATLALGTSRYAYAQRNLTRELVDKFNLYRDVFGCKTNECSLFSVKVERDGVTYEAFYPHKTERVGLGFKLLKEPDRGKPLDLTIAGHDGERYIQSSYIDGKVVIDSQGVPANEVAELQRKHDKGLMELIRDMPRQATEYQKAMKSR